ncbi:MAG: Periplasmic pH-dependent serine endoprotease DegQ [Alphaproteobacteria bacterium MarineAlpha5_Bin9]|nr:MAG: Periplasmic pH-dependent serine endoprotease DegQ [Alphaproteobacteria bacterium MarineAlpha5_Bin9]|tara:strand:+ start:4964 stop:6328 length:1365 start_codon:yes stop_codon:yes gene_type:complete
MFFKKILILITFISFSLNAKPVPETFADLVEGLIPAVVSIASTTTIINQSPDQNVPQFPEGSPFEDFFKEYFDQEKRNTPSQRPMTGLGSGFIIDQSGIIVTNNHVIEGADEITIIMSDQTEFKAELLGRDPKADLAVLKFNPDGKKLSYVRWGDSDSARVGDWSIAIGNPLGLGGTVTAGIISAISRDIGSGPYVKFIQTDASINRGNSGGPLFNINGEVIGINTAIISQSGGSIGLGFAIPSNSAIKIIEQLKEFGRTKRGYLGVEITDVSKEISESLGLSSTEGAFVSGLNPNGPAKAAGIEEGDIIVKFNGKKIKKMSDLPRLVAESDIGSISNVEIWRKNKFINIEVILGELPEKSYVKRSVSVDIEVASLGISIKEIKNQSGVEVTKVNMDSKLLKGDIITEVNREKVTSTQQFITLIKSIKDTGRNSLLLKILRNNNSEWITIKFKD